MGIHKFCLIDLKLLEIDFIQIKSSMSWWVHHVIVTHPIPHSIPHRMLVIVILKV